MSQAKTSWEKVGAWYNQLVGSGGHYYHQRVVLPGVLRLLSLKPNDRLIDIACGQGVLAQNIPDDIAYVGIDAARSLVEIAKKHDRSKQHRFLVADATKPFPISEKFTHAACILALQNIEHPQKLFQHTAAALEEKGVFVFVINHPAFRIPRQSSWGTDETNKLQYRRINRYLSTLKVPIVANPGAKRSEVTWSFHWPLQDLFSWLHNSGFVVEQLEEWVSDKSSEGKAAKMENRSRKEFPLFLAIRARKLLADE